MASGDGPALAHRSVSNIRTAPGQQPTPSTPHTPPRAIHGSYGSPATVRADDDFLLIEIGSRNIRVGFAGDSVPKAVLSSGPQDQRRAGDFRQWTESEALREYWAPEYEIWRYDLRDFDLGLFQDKLERMLRDAFTRYGTCFPRHWPDANWQLGIYSLTRGRAELAWSWTLQCLYRSCHLSLTFYSQNSRHLWCRCWPRRQ
jgi:hypothetical protein